MTEKRKPGRPVGTGKNDAPYLAQVADLMVANPRLKPRTAMQRVMAVGKNWDAASDDALLHRWQEKWKRQGAAFLTAARERARVKAAPAAPRRAVAYGYDLSLSAAALAEQKRLFEISAPAREALRAFNEGPQAQMIREQMKQFADMQKLLDQPHYRNLRQQLERMRSQPDAFNVHQALYGRW